MLNYSINALHLNITLLILYNFLILYNNSLKNRRLLFTVLSTVNWILLSGLRHINIGADTINYMNHYYNGVNTKWSDIFLSFKEIEIFGSKGRDAGYFLFQKITQLFAIDYRFYLFIVAIIFTVLLGLWLYKNSSDLFISFLLYSILFYSFFSFTGTRQTLAMTLVVLIGYQFIKQKKLVPFLVISIIAITIHKSAIVFFPFYFIADFRITKNSFITAFIMFVILFYYRIPVSLFFQNVSGYNYGVYDNAGTTTFTLLLLSVFAVAFWRMDIIINHKPIAIHYYNALILSVLFTPLTWVNPSAMRVVQYFSVFLMLLIPEIVNSFKYKEKYFIYYSIVVLMIIIFIQTNPTYLFFWQ